MTATHIPGHGVFIPDGLAFAYWDLMRRKLEALQLDGGRVTPALREAQEALRAAAQEAASAHGSMSARSANGHVSGQVADMARGSKAETAGVIGTAALADQLGVGTRHARRLAKAAGIAPAARDAWHSQDVAHLIELRRQR